MHPRGLTAAFAVVVAAFAAAIGCAAAAGDGAVARIALVRYHDPSAGWTAQVPAAWPSAGIGPQFVRAKSLDDPTVLFLWTFWDREPGAALREFTDLSSSTSPTAAGTRATKTLQWRRYRSHARADAAVAIELAVAKQRIDNYVWPSGPEGVTDGWGNLRLRPRDVAKLAFLYLHHGRWNGRTIVPGGWVTSSTTDWVADPAYEYGYQWWLDRADGYAFMSGRFGQTAIVAPRADLVVVITAHLPDTMSGTTPRLSFERYILPAVR